MKHFFTYFLRVKFIFFKVQISVCDCQSRQRPTQSWAKIAHRETGAAYYSYNFITRAHQCPQKFYTQNLPFVSSSSPQRSPLQQKEDVQWLHEHSHRIGRPAELVLPHNIAQTAPRMTGTLGISPVHKVAPAASSLRGSEFTLV